MINVHFYGALAPLVEGGEHAIDVCNPLDAVLFLEAVLPGFKKVFRSGHYFLSLEKDGKAIEAQAMRLGFGKQGELHICPAVRGRKAGPDPSTIAPSANAYEDREENLSALFNGAINTTEQGVCRPLLYGRVTDAGSAVISAGISSEQIPYSES